MDIRVEAIDHDLCFLTSTPLDSVLARLRALDVDVEEGRRMPTARMARFCRSGSGTPTAT